MSAWDANKHIIPCIHYTRMLILILGCNARLIRLSSPNLNYIIGLGVLVLYVDVYLSIVPTTDRDVVSALCNVSVCDTISS